LLFLNDQGRELGLRLMGYNSLVRNSRPSIFRSRPGASLNSPSAAGTFFFWR
jgi:hypothetical protein